MSINSDDINNDVCTGAREMLKITQLLNKNGYEYDGESGSNWYNHKTLHFTKPIRYTDWNGNWINDNHITVTIKYNRHFVTDENTHKTKESDVDEDVKKIRLMKIC